MTALLFDLDGCLVDSLPVIRACWARTLPRFGFTPPTQARAAELAGPPVDAVARELLPDADPATLARVVAAYRRCSVAHAAEIRPFPGVDALLAELGERGVRLGLATSKSIEAAEPILDALGWRERFTVVHGTPREHPGTDKATVVARALVELAELGEHAGGRPGWLVGDRRHDVGGAHAHGLRAAGVLWGYGGRAELTAAGADALLDAPGDVLGLLAA